MTRCKAGLVVVWLLSFEICLAQKKVPPFPQSIVIASDSFIDIGPPFNFYELFRITPSGNELSVERVFVTPQGGNCMQPATVEVQSLSIHKTLPELLQGKNPCAIPEKELHRELKRCKKCLVFSGVNVTMQASCNDQDRAIHMDILDRDMFDARVATPEHTSWTMKVLGELRDVSGPGAMEKPVFATGESSTIAKVPDTETVRLLRQGKYDALFGARTPVSMIVRSLEGDRPVMPAVNLSSVAPFAPVTPEMPKYPPIARAARIEGEVMVNFDVDESGKATHLAAIRGIEALKNSSVDAVSKWSFPVSARGRSGSAILEYRLNCAAVFDTSVN
jgi:TonB family protein